MMCRYVPKLGKRMFNFRDAEIFGISEVFLRCIGFYRTWKRIVYLDDYYARVS